MTNYTNTYVSNLLTDSQVFSFLFLFFVAGLFLFFLFFSPGLLNRGTGGPDSLGHVPHSCIFSPTDLNFLCTELYNNLTPTLLPASVTNRTNSISPRSRLYPDIPRPDAPVIYTGAFPILKAWPGSICYNDSRADVGRLMAERQDTKSSVKFRFQLEASYVSSHTEELWFNKTVCPWCSHYRRRKWTRRHEFKSWTRLHFT